MVPQAKHCIMPSSVWFVTTATKLSHSSREHEHDASIHVNMGGWGGKVATESWHELTYRKKLQELSAGTVTVQYQTS